jgi:hypothetical protein
MLGAEPLIRATHEKEWEPHLVLQTIWQLATKAVGEFEMQLPVLLAILFKVVVPLCLRSSTLRGMLVV